MSSQKGDGASGKTSGKNTTKGPVDGASGAAKNGARGGAKGSKKSEAKDSDKNRAEQGVMKKFAHTKTAKSAEEIEQRYLHLLSFSRQWWRNSVMGTVDQTKVIEGRREACEISARFLFMTAMSAGIAILGLLQSSAAVIIGAMLLSPLMDPIMGLGFALATGDYAWLRRSARVLAWGTLMAIVLTALIVFLSPLKDMTPEIASRTRPNLFDLLIALFSALAGAYAVIRGRENTIVGVAIATALMPPLAVVGYGLATFNWTVFSGALMLYITNLITIALTASLMARLYGFRTLLTQKQTQKQTMMIVAAFFLLAVPLGYSLYKIAWEAKATQTIRSDLEGLFDENSRLAQLKINWDVDPISVVATVLTPHPQKDAERKGTKMLEDELGIPVNLTMAQSKTAMSDGAADQAAIDSARLQEDQADRKRAEELAERLALIAGVPTDEVVVDRQRRRAIVRSTEVEGASLRAYARFELRIAATEPEWQIELIPPARPLPVIAFEDGEPTSEGIEAISLIAWASQRISAPVVLNGSDDNAQRARTLITNAGGLPSRIESGGGAARTQVQARWDDITR